MVLPPASVAAALEPIRRAHDRKVGRWMPHVNLLYPFRPPQEWDEALPRVREVAAARAPFRVELRRFRWFEHGRGYATIWLEPESGGALEELHRALWEVFPDCDDVRRHDAGFTPHLSVGQARGADRGRALLAELTAGWRPLSFQATEVALLARDPEGPFEVGARVALGSCAPRPYHPPP